MAIPPYDSRGVLPEGIYDSTLPEILRRFGQFETSDQRMNLANRLASFVTGVQSTGLISEIYVDGSFVTNKEKPNDIDLILVLQQNHDFTAALSPFDYGLLSSVQVRRKFKFDVLVAPARSQSLSMYIDYFQEIKGVPGQRKGILRIAL